MHSIDNVLCKQSTLSMESMLSLSAFMNLHLCCLSLHGVRWQGQTGRNKPCVLANLQFDTLLNNTAKSYICCRPSAMHAPFFLYTCCILLTLAKISLPLNAYPSSICSWFFCGKTSIHHAKIQPPRRISLNFVATTRQSMVDSMSPLPS